MPASRTSWRIVSRCLGNTSDGRIAVSLIQPNFSLLPNLPVAAEDLGGDPNDGIPAWQMSDKVPKDSILCASSLAPRAVVGSPPSQQNAPDRGLAPQAGKSGAQVDAVLELKEAPRAVRIHVIADRRSAQPDGDRK